MYLNPHRLDFTFLVYSFKYLNYRIYLLGECLSSLRRAAIRCGSVCPTVATAYMRVAELLVHGRVIRNRLFISVEGPLHHARHPRKFYVGWYRKKPTVERIRPDGHFQRRLFSSTRVLPSQCASNVM